MKKRLIELDVSHVAIDLKRYEQETEDGLYSWSPKQRVGFNQLLLDHFQQVARFGHDVVLELRREPQ